MQIRKKFHKTRKDVRNHLSEDMKYLQKRISGRSVYRKLGSIYARRPKHRKLTASRI